MKQKFPATIDIIDINPFVPVPDQVMRKLQKDAKKDKGPIPVKGTLEDKPYKQTVVKFRGMWRLYLNTPMRQASKTHVGDKVTVEIEFDPKPRTVPIPKQFSEALANNKQAKVAFDNLPPYHQKEIVRYLGYLKSEAALIRNIERIIQFLTGKKIKGVLNY